MFFNGLHFDLGESFEYLFAGNGDKPVVWTLEKVFYVEK